MNKKIYKPSDWVKKQKSEIEKEGWFTFDKQDELAFNIAMELYLEYIPEDRTKQIFEDCIKHATELCNVYYDYKFNPRTRRPRNGKLI